MILWMRSSIWIIWKLWRVYIRINKRNGIIIKPYKSIDASTFLYYKQKNIFAWVYKKLCMMKEEKNQNKINKRKKKKMNSYIYIYKFIMSQVFVSIIKSRKINH